jgi:hypothetical protein
VTVTWLTPFWWLQERIEEQYPGAYLYEVVGKNPDERVHVLPGLL